MGELLCGRMGVAEQTSIVGGWSLVSSLVYSKVSFIDFLVYQLRLSHCI